MQYNTQRPTLIMPEYGRGIQDMVEMAIGLPTKIERERCARAIVSIMAFSAKGNICFASGAVGPDSQQQRIGAASGRDVFLRV